MTSRGRAVRWILYAAIVSVALTTLACGGKDHVTAPTPAPGAPPPAADSPTGVVRRLEWAWQHRDSVRVADVLPGEFEFVFALMDSAGNPSREPPLDRSGMLCATGQLFVGGGARPRASSISLHFDPTLNATPDSRPGKNPGWHKEILSGVDLQIVLQDGSAFEVTGFAAFFVVRGDSAAIPPDLAARGVTADSTRWFIERWNDESISSGARARPADPKPASPITWGDVLELYRCGPSPVF